MIKPKIYIAKVTRGTDGEFVVGTSAEIQEHFRGACYNKADGLEAYGKTRSYTETYPESPLPDVFFPDNLTREKTDFILTLYFFDIDNHEEETEAIKAVDEAYHAFVDYISGTLIKYWDNVRQRKVLLAYLEPTKPTVDRLYGFVYKEVSFKFTNLYGRSFPLDSTEF